MPNQDKTALVISGGTARGAYAAGLVHELFKDHPGLGPKVNLISGTSTGSLIAPMLSLYLLQPEKNRELLDRIVEHYQVDSTKVFRDEPRTCLWSTAARLARLKLDAQTARMGAMLAETGAVLDTAPLRAIVDGQLTDQVLAPLFVPGCPLECIVNCVSAQTGGVVAFSSAAPGMNAAVFRDAVYASCLQPIFMPLQPIVSPATGKREEFMDGGVRDVVPAYSAWRAGATRMLLIALSHAGDGEHREEGPFSGREHLLDLLQRVVLGLLDQEVQDDDLLQARYLATIGKLVAFARGKGATDELLEKELLAELAGEERSHFLGPFFLRDLLVHRPADDVPLEETFRWDAKGMEKSIEAGREAARGEAGRKMRAFLAA